MINTGKHNRGPIRCWGADIEELHHPSDCEGLTHYVSACDWYDCLNQHRVAYLCPSCTRIGLATSAIRDQFERPPMVRENGIWTTNPEAKQ